jgi:hypothetical protein
VTRPTWAAEDKTIRDQLREEGLRAAVTEAEIWAKAAAQRAQQMKEARQSETRNRRLATPSPKPARR